MVQISPTTLHFLTSFSNNLIGTDCWSRSPESQGASDGRKQHHRQHAGSHKQVLSPGEFLKVQKTGLITTIKQISRILLSVRVIKAADI